MSLKRIESTGFWLALIIAGVSFVGVSAYGSTAMPIELPNPELISQMNVVQCLTYICLSSLALAGVLALLLFKQTQSGADQRQAMAVLTELIKSRKCLLDEKEYVAALRHPPSA